jgi:hypothetical protein
MNNRNPTKPRDEFMCSIVCPSSIYGFWLPHWYFQTLLSFDEYYNLLWLVSGDINTYLIDKGLILASNREYTNGLMNNRNLIKPRDEFMCSGTVTSSCSIGDNMC